MGGVTADLPRYLPDQPLPPYTYVPGKQPHPVNDPAGHSFGRTEAAVEPPDPARPFESRSFLMAVDLFNHSYYWEAHEEWERLWHACGRRGVRADFLKGLIKLAAAGVKQLEGRPIGVVRHLARARELFAGVAEKAGGARYLGLAFDRLTAIATLPTVLELNVE